MSFRILVGLDGAGTGARALDYARQLATVMDACEIIVIYVIEWSPFSFQTPEENAQRHKRRLEELTQASERIVDPAVSALTSEGFTARGMVHHGDVADTLIAKAKELEASQIIVGRSSEVGLTKRLFGSSSVNLVMHSPVPVTVVG